MKKGLVILTMIGILAIFFLYFRNAKDREIIARGNMIVQQIDNFNQKEGYLPNSLDDLGIKDENLFYNKWDSMHYMVWYGASLGESITYYSDSKKWKDRQREFLNP